MSTANNSSLIVDQLITYADWFFPGEIDYDRDLEVGIMNCSENQTIGMRRCVSNSSLSDHGESPPQGSPKPAARRKNKHAPTPPSTTPDKHEKRYDDKPPPAPDKPPRPLTSTLNRATYKPQKHEVNTELIRRETTTDKPEKHTETNMKQSVLELAPTDFHFIDLEKPQEISTHQSEIFDLNEIEKNNQELQKHDTELNIPNTISDNIIKPCVEIECNETTPKLVPTEKPLPSTLERKKPVAAPRSITNIIHNTGKMLFNIV